MRAAGGAALAAALAAAAAGPAAAQEAGDWSIEPFGRVQSDLVYADAPAGGPALGWEHELRRVRVGLGGDLPGGLGYKVEVDFAGHDVTLTDAILTLDAGPVELTAGQHNSFQSLEELTSSRFTSFIERTAFTDAFGFERRIGLSAHWQAGELRADAGVFADDLDGLTADEDDGWSVDGRLVWSPTAGDAQLHFGGSLHRRERDGAEGTVRYRQRAFAHAFDERFVATPALAAIAETSGGIEAAAIAGRLHAAAEAHWLRAALPGAEDPVFFGGYAEIGWFLTDDSRGYRGGRFDRTRPSHPLGEGGIGAVQVNLRYDRLDLDDAGIAGGTQDTLAASLIWTPIANARLMLNYARVGHDGAAIALANGERDYAVDVVAARAEFDF